MEIFKPIKDLDENKLHPKYKLLRDNNMLSLERRLLESWTEGMIDKDHKMVREFQESFHSCLWEFYLYRLFIDSGFVIEQNHQMPDFFITSPNKFYVEAVVSNIREGGKGEDTRTIDDLYELMLPPYLYKNFYRDLDESITRHSNSLQQKLKKYNKDYSKRDWVDTNCPFVIALGSYNQINYGREYIYSMMALLYGGYYDAEKDSYYNKDHIIKPGTSASKIPLGVFTDKDMEEDYKNVSAVIFSCTLSLGKLTSLLISDGLLHTNKVYNIRRCNKDGDAHGKYLLQIVSPNSPEEFADGLFVFHNPNAKIKLPENLFANIPVTQFFFENGNVCILGNETPLVARHNTSILLNKLVSHHVQECVRMYNRLSIEEFYNRFNR